MDEPRHLLGISAGARDGSAEIALKAALQAAEEAGTHVRLIRLEDLALPSTAVDGVADDVWWVWDRILDADALIISAPIFSRCVPARLKVVMDRLLGPNADRAIVEKMLSLQAAGEEPSMPFRLDERVLKDRVAGFIAVGGSLTPQWKTLMMPEMHTMTFSMQTAVVDQLVVSGTGTPQSIVLDEAALDRARRLGANVASQIGRAFDDVEYLGEPGLCPMCHLSVVELAGRDVTCATCGARGRLEEDPEIRWTDLDTSVISMAEKSAHYDEILQTAQRHAAQRPLIQERAAAFTAYDRSLTPHQQAPNEQHPSNSQQRREQLS